MITTTTACSDEGQTMFCRMNIQFNNQKKKYFSEEERKQEGKLLGIGKGRRGTYRLKNISEPLWILFRS